MKILNTIALAATLCASSLMANDDVVIVANPGVSAASVSAEDLKQVFLGAKNNLAGGSVEPVLADKGGAHEAFLKKYVGKSDTAYRMHLKSLVFAGKASMPKTVADDAAVLAYVAKTKGAIGYVSAGAATAGVKKLDVK